METIAGPRLLASAAPARHILSVSTDTDHRPAVAASAGADSRGCQHPECAEPGLYRAPKSRARLREYYWFCLEHVRAYNSAWNYCAGFSEADFEAQARGQACWERPTWRLGEWHTQRPEPAMASFAEAFGIEGDEEAGDNRSRRRQERPPPAATDDKALAVLGLAPAATWAEIKARYKRLVKRYHPDANGGDRQAEERLKVINQAYSTLRKRPVAS
jgi:DnaJ-like protein